MNICTLIDRLIDISIKNNLIDEMDTIYIRNRLLALFKEDTYTKGININLNLHETLEGLLSIAVDNNLIKDTLYEKDIFSSNIMNIFVPIPSLINKEFLIKYHEDPKKATDYFYNLSKSSNYIKTDRIAKNIGFKSNSPYGDMEITINLSKPEKDPKQIALEKTSKKNNYPKCLLCVENEGYEGNITHPDRANHRTIRLDFNNKSWMMQYSPYLYYNEHCIVLCTEHIPMTINKNTFINLLEFVSIFPHYFIGSNADLPIVGGSILAHEHYQGGRHEFPMNNAENLFDFKLDKFNDIEFSAIKWPLSTIRLKSNNIKSLVHCSSLILDAWRNYDDESLNILSHSLNDVPHNTITPIARFENNKFILDLVLRNNRTSTEHPLGIFHPHSDVHHIKKENIGLIEVMGLAVLPGRLSNELNDIKRFLNNTLSIDNIKDYHRTWAIYLKDKLEENTSIDEFINKELGNKFIKVLEDCGVFKLTPRGIEGFKKFINHVNNM